MHIRKTILILLAVTISFPIFSQRLSKKQLKKERIELLKTIDSLKSIIDGGITEMSDTTNIEEEDTLSTMEQLDFSEIESFEEETISRNENPDSLLSIWYVQKRLKHSRSNDFDMDSITLTSNIPDAVYIDRLNKLNSFIPLSYNSIVKNHIIFYTEKIPLKAKNILGLSSYYLPMFEEIFNMYDMPGELKAVAIIESALNPVATSRVNARGMWQFMYRTALQYDLKINSYIDERLDPIASAHAAAKYLKDAYSIFGDWFLAISSYNCGIGNVNKAIRRAGSKDFWKIYPYLPRETRGYVPSFIAALYLLNYYNEHNINPTKFNLPAHVDTFHVNKNLHFEQISAIIGIPVEDIKNYNPKYTQNIIPGNENGNILQLPFNYTIPFIDKEKEIYAYKDSIYFNPITEEKAKIIEPKLEILQPKTHIVKKGETLGGIAIKYGVKLSNLMKWNKLTSRSVLKVGQRLKINNISSSYTANNSNNDSPKTKSSKKRNEYLWYTIKKGDTLLSISYKFKGVSLSDILKINGLTKNSRIYPGKKIKIKRL